MPKVGVLRVSYLCLFVVIGVILFDSQVAMCNFKSVGDAASVAIATMHSGIRF